MEEQLETLDGSDEELTEGQLEAWNWKLDEPSAESQTLPAPHFFYADAPDPYGQWWPQLAAECASLQPLFCVMALRP